MSNEPYYPGKGCMCAAQSEAECGCSGVDWTPVEVYSLREDVNRLKRENAALQKDRKRLDGLTIYISSHRYPWGVAWGFAAPSHSQDLREAIDRTMETIK